MNILVVEDEPTNREIVEVILKSEGHCVTSCEDGQQALTFCLSADTKFDLVIMDILMPVMDGLEATRRLRAHTRMQEIPIICVTAKASGSDEKTGMEAGCDSYVKKPYRRKELLAAIQQTLLVKGKILPDEVIAHDL
ncbi:MAG: response regulator [Cyanobacteria bacterium NC_groundwater_1444_Ag_S-0.65um_54_12]|nr:response regulator [Cyanobacteria bacterium NC_groundwater_1444_Ag_S-0.65um_54_12]